MFKQRCLCERATHEDCPYSVLVPLPNDAADATLELYGGATSSRFVWQGGADKTKVQHAFPQILLFRHSELEASIFDGGVEGLQTFKHYQTLLIMATAVMMTFGWLQGEGHALPHCGCCRFELRTPKRLPQPVDGQLVFSLATRSGCGLGFKHASADPRSYRCHPCAWRPCLAASPRRCCQQCAHLSRDRLRGDHPP